MFSISFPRVSYASLVMAGVLGMGALGCARMPKTGADATGELLNVEVRSETHTYTTQAKVGEVVNKDSSGRVVGTSEVYENRTGSYDVTRWQVFQGETPIDDQDFFRIGGDIRSAKAIAEQRKSGMTLNRIGLGILAGGGVAAVGGMILGYAMAPPEGSLEKPSKIPTALLTTGLIACSVGGIMAFMGSGRVNQEHPIDDPARANAVAKSYNKKLGSGAAPASNDDDEEEEEPKPKPKKKKKKSSN